MKPSLPAPFSVSDAAPDLAQRFALILAGLGALVARRFLRMPHLMRFTVLLYSRLSRMVKRFERALTRPARLRVARVRVRVRVRVRADRTEVARAPRLALPSGRGWIVRELGWEAAGFMAQLEALLAEAGSRAALARTPRARRILRPICRMLGMSVEAVPKISRAAQATVAGTRFTHKPVSACVPDVGAPRPARIFSAA